MLYEVITYRDIDLPSTRGAGTVGAVSHEQLKFLDVAMFNARTGGDTEVSAFRITSYNVCYTKLLRTTFVNDCAMLGRCDVIARRSGRQAARRVRPDRRPVFRADDPGARHHRHRGGDLLQPVGRHPCGDLLPVITSYSIHYTKLYE